MSVDVGGRAVDDATLDLNDFLDQFSAWYHVDGGNMNPYDATERFIDYYANKTLYLSFAKKKLVVMYVANASFIGIFAMILASFIMMLISIMTSSWIITIVFVSVTLIDMIVHVTTRIIIYCMSKNESDISIAVINFKMILTNVLFPDGSIADFINSITKQLPMKFDSRGLQSSDEPVEKQD